MSPFPSLRAIPQLTGLSGATRPIPDSTLVVTAGYTRCHVSFHSGPIHTNQLMADGKVEGGWRNRLTTFGALKSRRTIALPLHPIKIRVGDEGGLQGTQLQSHTSRIPNPPPG